MVGVSGLPRAEKSRLSEFVRGRAPFRFPLVFAETADWASKGRGVFVDRPDHAGYVCYSGGTS